MNQREEIAGAPYDLKTCFEKHTHNHVKPKKMRHFLVLHQERVTQVTVQHEEPPRPSGYRSGDEFNNVSSGVVLF